MRQWTYALLAEAFYDRAELTLTEVGREGVRLVPQVVKAENIYRLINQAFGGASLKLEPRKLILLQSDKVRQQVLLFAFGGASDVFLGHPLWPLLLALRHIRKYVVVRPWSNADLLAAILTAHYLTSPSLARPALRLAAVPPKEYIQRSTELLAGLGQVSSLAEALLVIDWVEPSVHCCFGGKLFHGLMGIGTGLGGAVKGMGEADEKVVLAGMKWVLE